MVTIAAWAIGFAVLALATTQPPGEAPPEDPPAVAPPEASEPEPEADPASPPPPEPLQDEPAAEAPVVEPAPPRTIAPTRRGAVARTPRGEVLIDAVEAPRPIDQAARPVHGQARLGVGFGAVMQDPIALVHPSIALDFAELAPVSLRVGAPIRFRMIDRAPDQSGVVRRRDWDEAGDGIAVLEALDYGDELVVGQSARAAIDVHAGALRNVSLGNASLLRGYDNALDVDRRRTGVDARTRIVGDLARYPASFDAAVVIGDLAGSQVLAAHVGGRWAGAGLGFTAVGDPTAPSELDTIAGRPDRFERDDDRGRLVPTGRIGMAGIALDVSYEATDRWRWRVLPYVDLVLLPSAGKGIHIGSDAEVVLGRRRRVRLGAVAEITVGDRDYAPAYFDVFYTAERWQTPLVATPDDRPDDLVDVAAPKLAFVRDANLFGAGGYGAIRFSHAAGAFAETGYQVRPGPRGHTWSLRVGTELRVVTLAVLLAHRGRHGFEPVRAGSLAAVDLRVPIIAWVDVFSTFGWTFAVRADPTAAPGGEATGLVTGAGFFVAGVGGRVPW